MKRIKILVAVLLVVVIGASAFNLAKPRAIDNFYPVISGSTVTTFTVDGSTLDDLIDGHCTSAGSTVCVVKQTGVSPATYQNFVLGGNYVQ